MINVSSEIQQKALSLIASNQKIAAVKLIMDHAQCGLKEAKDYADGLQVGIQSPASSATNLNEQLFVILSQGNKLNAIKYYKDATGAGLAESKDYVENLMENQTGSNSIQQNRNTDIKNIIANNAIENSGALKSFIVKLLIVILIAVALTYLMFKI
jgi:ribosomal protein L7/L12